MMCKDCTLSCGRSPVRGQLNRNKIRSQVRREPRNKKVTLLSMEVVQVKVAVVARIQVERKISAKVQVLKYTNMCMFQLRQVSPLLANCVKCHCCQLVNIEKELLLRFIVMGRKSLPDPWKKSRPYWGFVEMVTTRVEDVKVALAGEEYDTSTRGHRRNSPARAVGEGVYRILRHSPGQKKHTHLIYKLEFPPEDKENETQESLNIEHEGSFLILIKNPEQHGTSQFRGLQNKRKAVFPAHLQGQFGQKRYCPADPPDFLNYEGCEFLLISASDDTEEELGLELQTDAGEADASCSDLIKTFGETASTSALLRGTWV